MSGSRITTTFALPPQIMEVFNNALLTEVPDDIFRDSARKMFEMYQWIKVKLLYKIRNNPKSQDRCLQLEREFLELYERAKVKEKELKATTKHHTQAAFYHIEFACKKDEEVYRRYEWKRLRSSRPW